MKSNINQLLTNTQVIYITNNRQKFFRSSGYKKDNTKPNLQNFSFVDALKFYSGNENVGPS